MFYFAHLVFTVYNVSMNSNKLTFCTGVGTVTGANFLLETVGVEGKVGRKILVDCGMVQGERVAEEENSEAFSYDPASGVFQS